MKLETGREDLKKNRKVEILAGITTFFATVYIIVVNGSILSDTGMPLEGAMIATTIASFIGCFIMALWADSPCVVVPGMGINALFSYTIVKTMGLSWQSALAVSTLGAIVFAIVAFTKLADIITNSISNSLKESITVGIGLMLTFIGLQKSGIIISGNGTLLTLGSLSSPYVFVTLINLIIAVILFAKDIKGNFLISIIIGTIVAYFFGIVDVSGLGKLGVNFDSYKEVFYAFDFSHIKDTNFWVGVFSIALVLVFENIGLSYAQAKQLNDESKFKKILQATSLSTITCGILGTSPTVSSIETAAGIEAGGRTGITSMVTGALFLLALLFLPVIKIIPNVAVTPVLVIIGCLMLENIVNIEFNDFSEWFPSFLIIALIPLTFSIVDGMAFGFISYPIVKIAMKKQKDIKPAMYVICLMFLINFIL